MLITTTHVNIEPYINAYIILNGYNGVFWKIGVLSSLKSCCFMSVTFLVFTNLLKIILILK